MPQPLRIFIGFDPRQPVAYTTLQHSILTRASRPVAITPLVIEQLPIKRAGVTPFSYSRFLVPWLCDFEGSALFLDVDILVLADIVELFGMLDGSAVMVSKNRLRFEWASVMLFNCAHPENRILTPEHVESAENLHQIGWTNAIGELPGEWNHLVMYDPPKPAKLVHYTAGIPCFPETKDLGYAEEWLAAVKAATSAKPWRVLMRNTVHAKNLAKIRKQTNEAAPDVQTVGSSKPP